MIVRHHSCLQLDTISILENGSLTEITEDNYPIEEINFFQ